MLKKIFDYLFRNRKRILESNNHEKETMKVMRELSEKEFKKELRKMEDDKKGEL